MTYQSYKTLKKPSIETLYKEKGSKFYGYAFPVENEDEATLAINLIKQKHPKARHFCYAYQLGEQYDVHKVNDDGEPNNSAGLPIYGQIQSFSLTKVLVVVVRYFGGTKLGVGGLIQAYKTSAQITLQIATIIEKNIQESFEIIFEYPDTNLVLRLFQNFEAQIITQYYGDPCKIRFNVPLKFVDKIKEEVKINYKIKLKKN